MEDKGKVGDVPYQKSFQMEDCIVGWKGETLVWIWLNICRVGLNECKHEELTMETDGTKDWL